MLNQQLEYIYMKDHILAFLTGFEECEKACKMKYSILEDLS